MTVKQHLTPEQVKVMTPIEIGEEEQAWIALVGRVRWSRKETFYEFITEVNQKLDCQIELRIAPRVFPHMVRLNSSRLFRVILPGYSLLSLLHEIRHCMLLLAEVDQPHDEVEVQRWAISIFREAKPVSFSRLQFTDETFYLRKVEPPVEEVPEPDKPEEESQSE